MGHRLRGALSLSNVGVNGGAGGVYRSTNGGGRWTDISDDLIATNAMAVQSVVFVPDEPTKLLISANQQPGGSGWVHRSTRCQTHADCDDGMSCSVDTCDPAIPADGCRHDVSGADADSDGIPDSCDSCPTRRSRFPDRDYDADGALDGCADNCLGVKNPDQRNTDGCPGSPGGVCASPSDGTEGGDLCDACPACIGANCCTGLTARKLIGPFAGSITASDPALGSIKLDFPANTFGGQTSVAVTGVNQSAYGLGNLTNGAHIFDARFTPPGPLSKPSGGQRLRGRRRNLRVLTMKVSGI